MSSTVTTTTVTTLSLATNFEDLGRILTITAVALLALALLSRHISTAAQGPRGRRFARGLDVALMPLLVIFALVLALGLA